MSRSIAGLHSLSPLAVTSRYSPWRVWLLPLILLLPLVWLLAAGDDQALFVRLNRAGMGLPAPMWAALTSLGDTLPAFAILLPLVVRRPDAALAALIAILLASVGTHLLKHLVDLPRPAASLPAELFQVIGPRIGGRSFPSGHTAATFTVAALIAGHTLSRLALTPLLLAAGLIGFSRVAVGAHWPADVLAGAILGWLSGFAGLHLAARCGPKLARLARGFALILFVLATLWLLTGFESGYADARWVERGVALASLSLAAIIFFRQRCQHTGLPS